MEDKTGLRLGWGRTPKEGRDPRIMRSAWRDWAKAEEFKMRWEILSQEEVELNYWHVVRSTYVAPRGVY